MKKSKIIVKLILATFLFVNSYCSNRKEHTVCEESVQKKSFLWALKRDPPVYFFGTIHVPFTRVWSHVSQTVKKAFDGSENVFFELDLTDASTLTSLTHCQLLPENTGLREVLPRDLYQRLKRHLEYIKFAMPKWVTMKQKEKGLYADTLYEAIVGDWERKKPIWVMLMVNSLTEADIKTRGTPVLDLYLARKAEKMGKEIGAVEKVDEQCRPLNGLNISQVLFALNHTLLIQEKLRQGTMEMSYTTDDLIDQYNCGNLDAIMFDKESVQISAVTNRSHVKLERAESSKNRTDEVMATDIDSYFKNELIYLRNERMADRVKILLDENPRESYFFAFGAGHFLGNGSVIDFLKRHGYQIESVDSEILYRNKPVSKSKRHRNRRNRRLKRKRNRALRERRRKISRRFQNRKKKIKHMYKDIQTTLYDRRSFKIRPPFDVSPQVDESYTFLNQADIRIINHFPTVVPDLYGDRTRFKPANKQNSYGMRSSHYSRRRQGRRNKKRLSRYNENIKTLNSDLKNLGFKLWKQTTTVQTVPGSSTALRIDFLSFSLFFYLIQIVSVLTITAYL